jgi:NAD(P)H-hydrate epimerase
MRADVSSVDIDAAYCARVLPRRDPQGHKFTFGRVVTVCGSLDYAGAAYLTSLAAIRGGAGLVAMAVPDSIRGALAAKLPEAILAPLPESGEAVVDVPGAIAALSEREADALVVGPGLKETDTYRELLLHLIADAGAPAVIDAGAIGMLADTPGWHEHVRRDLILTPHAGEFGRLVGSEVGTSDGERARHASSAAAAFRVVIVLKGARTVVADAEGNVAVAPFSNPALATAGSGDVLAGVIGALIGQGASPFDAACAGVYLHGRAGERLSERLGDAGLMASEIAHEIPAARHELMQQSA